MNTLKSGKYIHNRILFTLKKESKSAFAKRNQAGTEKQISRILTYMCGTLKKIELTGCERNLLIIRGRRSSHGKQKKVKYWSNKAKFQLHRKNKFW
jgi:hypothetical protein